MLKPLGSTESKHLNIILEKEWKHSSVDLSRMINYVDVFSNVEFMTTTVASIETTSFLVADGTK
jgi:hypothetical protein